MQNSPCDHVAAERFGLGDWMRILLAAVSFLFIAFWLLGKMVAQEPQSTRATDDARYLEESRSQVKPAADWITDPAKLLEHLKQRDGSLENRTFRFEQRWVERVSPRAQLDAIRLNARKLAQEPGEEAEKADIPADYDQPHRVLLALTVRDGEVTIERLAELEEMKHAKYSAIPNIGHRWSTVGGIERSYSPETKTLHIMGSPTRGGVLQESRWMLQWCAGHGIARWMTSIESCQVVSDGLQLQGHVKLMGYDDSRVEILLDRDYIARRMVVTVPTEFQGGDNQYIVLTRGTKSVPMGPVVSSTGHFQRVLRGTGKAPKVYKEFDIVFVDGTQALTDPEYRERTEILPTKDTQTVDLRPRS